MAEKNFKVFSTSELIEYMKSLKWTRIPKELHVHHTWKPNHSMWTGDYQRTQYGMWNYHVNTRGWSDIAQHLSLAPDGKWIVGRDFMRSPISMSGRNYLGFMVEMIGNFDYENDKFEGAQKEAMLEFSNFFINFFKLDFQDDIKFHRQYSSKSCPGTSIDRNRFIHEVENYEKKKEETVVAWREPSVLFGIVTADHLNFRDRVWGKKLQQGPIEKGEYVRVLGANTTGSWLEVNYKGIIGWVSARYVYMVMDILPKYFSVKPDNAIRKSATAFNGYYNNKFIYDFKRYGWNEYEFGCIGRTANNKIISGFNLELDSKPFIQNAIYGVEVYPKIRMVESGIVGDETWIGDALPRVIVGYSELVNRIIILAHPKCDLGMAHELAREFAMSYAISMAPGKHCAVKFNNSYIIRPTKGSDSIITIGG